MLGRYKQRKEEIRVGFDDLCPLNAQMTSHKIQKDLTKSFALDISSVINEEIWDSLFTVLIDESCDVNS